MNSSVGPRPSNLHTVETADVFFLVFLHDSAQFNSVVAWQRSDKKWTVVTLTEHRLPAAVDPDRAAGCWSHSYSFRLSEQNVFN